MYFCEVLPNEVMIEQFTLFNLIKALSTRERKTRDFLEIHAFL